MSRLSIDWLFSEPITVQSLHNIKELAVYFAIKINQDVKVVDIYLGGFSFNYTIIRITTQNIVLMPPSHLTLAKTKSWF
jgi:hypothetical protein